MARRIEPPRRSRARRAPAPTFPGAVAVVVVLLVALALSLIAPVAPAEATTTTEATELTTETSGPGSSTTSSVPLSTTSSVPATTAPSSSTSTSTSASTPSGGDVEGDAEVELDDPLSDEGRAEDAPDVDPDIPPPETYGGQEPYTPPEILWSSVAEAERKLERSREAKRDAVADVRVLRLRAKHLALDRAALDDRTRQTIEDLTAALERYRRRAVADYRAFGAAGSPAPAHVIDSAELDRALERRRGARLAEAALVVGDEDLAHLDDLRQGLDEDARVLLDRLSLVADYLGQAELAASAADEEIEQAAIEYEAFRAGSEIFVGGVVYPIGGPYDVPIIDSFGFPRMTGTPDEHWHEGIDLFAPRGTPLVAAERGIITRIGIGRLGGLKLWLVGESGAEWYYAHLDSFAPGLTDGLLVEAGDLLGYVGNTGNAVGTPPHLHLQLHPDGGRPVNPYPLLKIVSDLELEALADGTHRGWEHEPVVANPSAALVEGDG